MIQFTCPACKTAYEAEAGHPGVCPGCGQAAPGQESGNLLPADAAEANVWAEPQVQLVLGRPHVFWTCPRCRGSVDVPVDARQRSARCPHCGQRIAVPAVAERHYASAAEFADESPTYALATPEPSPSRPRRSNRDHEPERPLRRSRFRRPSYDDDYERGAADLQRYMRAASSGLLLSVLGLAMMAVAFVLWIAATRARADQQAVLIFALFGVVLVSFVLNLLGTLFSSRGLNRVNESNRGIATSGLVCGIIGLVISTLVGLVVFCTGVVLLSQRGMP